MTPQDVKNAQSLGRKGGWPENKEEDEDNDDNSEAEDDE